MQISGESPVAQFRVLGMVEVDHGDGPRAIPGRQQRALLTALLLRANHVVPAAALADALWGEDLPAQAENALHAVVARLRRAMGPAGELVVTRPPGYVLRAGGEAIDAVQFEMLCRAARSARTPGERVRLLDEGLALWRGPAHAEFADGFARAAATRLEELRLLAMEDRIEALIDADQLTEALAEAQDVSSHEPLRERPVAILMRVLHRLGRTGDALTAYRDHRALIAETLGLDPSAGLQALEIELLQDTPPPPAPPAAPPRGRGDPIPPRPSPLVGRQEEMSGLLRVLDSRRLVTLVGPGGVGKTRLALELAHRLREAGRRLWWVDLAPLGPAEVADAIAAAAGAHLQGAVDAPGSLGEALSAHRGVLFLDNAERVLDSLAPLVEVVAATAPGIVVVTTSRERIGLDGELLQVVPPLATTAAGDETTPAVQLFLDRMASSAEPGPEARHTISEICRRLDGLPLAIELAAARVATLGLAELANRLDQRLDLLAGGRRTAARRHQTLRSVVDWSHELLSEPQANLFARLSVFAGAFRLDQVESICSDAAIPPTEVPRLLTHLVEQSLVQAHEGRFWLLDTLRLYAAEQLADRGAREALRAKHAHHVGARLSAASRAIWSSSEPEAVAEVAALIPDLRAAWAYAERNDRSLAIGLAADIYSYAYFRQRLELLRWATIAQHWELPHPRRAGMLATAAAASWADGDFALSESLARQGLAVADDDPASAIEALATLGDLAMFEGRTDDAVAHYQECARRAQASGNEARALCSEVGANHARTLARRWDEVRPTMPTLVARAEAAGLPTVAAFAHYVMGESVADEDTRRAHYHFREAMTWAGKADSRLFGMIAMSSWATLLARSGPPEEALQAFEQVLDEWERIENVAAQGWVLGSLVLLLERIREDDDAAILTGAIRAASRRIPSAVVDQSRVEAAVASIGERVGRDQLDRLLAAGGALPFPATLEHARAAIGRAYQRIQRTEAG